MTETQVMKKPSHSGIETMNAAVKFMRGALGHIENSLGIATAANAGTKTTQAITEATYIQWGSERYIC